MRHDLKGHQILSIGRRQRCSLWHRGHANLCFKDAEGDQILALTERCWGGWQVTPAGTEKPLVDTRIKGWQEEEPHPTAWSMLRSRETQPRAA
ncbi:hypothetical protein WJX72_010714 [[Myrmecia] bisecta]|uniref:Uncharacterized protein n=1 Tax=[Myrmecia] bisecta TaxID=41462 RepID=A0AAW1PU45_9CHLO